MIGPGLLGAPDAHAFLKSVQKQYGGTYSSSAQLNAAQERQLKRMLAQRAIKKAEAQAKSADEAALGARRAKEHAADAVAKFICIQRGKC